MNPTKIEWTQFTWNPWVGCTGEDCAVRAHCYARAQAKRQKQRCRRCYKFIPHYHPERLNEPLRRKTPSLIFTVSMGDLFSAPDWFIGHAVLEVMHRANWHTFQILTKQAQRLQWHSPYPRNVWVGVTVNRQDDVWRLLPLRAIKAAVRFASFEPLYGAIDYDLSWLDWVIIGAQTKPEKQPKSEWIDNIITASNADVLKPGPRLFIKNNLQYPKIQAFPGDRWAMGPNGRPEAMK